MLHLHGELGKCCCEKMSQTELDADVVINTFEPHINVYAKRHVNHQICVTHMGVLQNGVAVESAWTRIILDVEMQRCQSQPQRSKTK